MKNFLKYQRNPQGFTLVEVLVAVAILAISVILIFAIYFTSQKFYQKTETKAEILQNARVIFERLAREIRQAQQIITALPQEPDNIDFPPTNEIEFQDGHNPSSYSYLGSDYYYIKYFFSTSTGEMHRQYKVYCFDQCSECSAFFRWNDSQMIEGVLTQAHDCVLEDRVIGEFIKEIKFWGTGPLTIYLLLEKSNEQIDFKTNVFGRNF